MLFNHVMGTCNLTRLHTLGCGSSATVSLATDSRGRRFAVKSVKLERSEPVQREQKLLSLINCPRIVTYLGHEITVENNFLFYNLFLEYVAGGTLSDAIRQHGGSLEESVIRSCTGDILRGLAYLHSMGVVHCDIKGRNILMAADGAKIADLGCARWAGDNAGPISGTPLYMAPEVARGEEQGLPGDVWAVGCTVIEMATGRPPWTDAVDPLSALHRIGESVDGPEIPRGLSDQGRDFLSKSLRRYPNERWTVDQLLKHPFVDGVKKNTEFGSVFSGSPKSTLEQGFWGCVEETQMHPDQIQVTASSSSTGNIVSPAERIRMLVCSNPSSTTSCWTWDSENSWVCVRRNVDVEMSNIEPVTVNSSSAEGLGMGSWVLIREESSICRGMCVDETTCRCNECDVICYVSFSTFRAVFLFCALDIAVGALYFRNHKLEIQKLGLCLGPTPAILKMQLQSIKVHRC